MPSKSAQHRQAARSDETYVKPGVDTLTHRHAYHNASIPDVSSIRATQTSKLEFRASHSWTASKTPDRALRRSGKWIPCLPPHEVNRQDSTQRVEQCGECQLSIGTRRNS